MMKKILLPLIFSFSFSALAITPEQLCADFRAGNKSILKAQYKGKEITYTGKIHINYVDDQLSRFIGFNISGNDLYFSAIKDLNHDEDVNPYLSMDGKTKTIVMTLSKNNPVEITGYNRECQINGALISIN